MGSFVEQLAERVKAFPAEQQQEVLHYVEFLEMKLSTGALPTQPLHKPRISLAEAMSKYAGCLDGGPEDLSINKAYMEGFGEV